MPTKILVVEDEDGVREILVRVLRMRGYQVCEMSTGDSAWERLQAEAFDLAILDIRLPGLDGFELCRMIRRHKERRATRILLLTAMPDEVMDIKARDEGADDFLCKPFTLQRLFSRITALLRHPLEPAHAAENNEVIRRGAVEVRPNEHRVFVDCREVNRLTPKEFELLRQLLLVAPRILDKQTAALKAWGQPLDALHARTLDVHMRRIRKKLGDAGAHSLETIPTIGYRWRQP